MKSVQSQHPETVHTSRIGRRSFIAGGSALGVLGSVAHRAAAQTPKRGGHLIIGMPSASTTDLLDPGTYRNDFMLALGGQIYDKLAEIDSRIQAQPSLAESWDAKPGAQEWVLKLRKGVIFHNGKEMAAADVVYSLDHHRKKESRSSAKIFASMMVDIKATDKHEVTIKLDGPNVDLPYILTLHQLVVVPEGADFKAGIGTGPYKIESFEPGVRSIAKRNPNDWHRDRGYVDSVETIGINESTARLNALLSGRVHLVERVSASAAALLEKNPEMQLFTIPGAGHYALDMKMDVPPFDKLEVRQALKYAIDREAILKIQQRGYGRIGNDHPISPLDPYFAADIPQRLYDPDKAKHLIKMAGFDGSIKLTVSDAAFGGSADTGQLFQASAAKAGIKIEVNRVPADGYYTNAWVRDPFVNNFWGGRPTPSMMFTHVYSAKAVMNSTHWNSARFEQLLQAARAETDTAKRRQIYRDMQFMLHDEGGAIIPLFTSYLDAGSKKVKGFVSFPLYEMSGYRAAEKVWLEG